MTTWSRKPSAAASRPPAAIEISTGGVLAAAVRQPGQPPSFAWQPLPSGSVAPGLAESNLPNPKAVTDAIRAALSPLSPRGKALTLIVPDAAVRLFVLDFDTLPSRAAEAMPILRFRLRKMVPFDVEQAGVSYQILSHSPTACRVLAAILPGPIQHEYERAVQAAGYEPGVVLPFTLAALAGIDSLESVLAVHLSGSTMTTAIANGNDLLLYRTVDLPETEAQKLDEVRRGIAVSLAYFEDQLHARPTQLYFAGTGGADAFGRWLDDPELTIADLAPQPETGLLTPLGEATIAAVAGALAEV